MFNTVLQLYSNYSVSQYSTIQKHQNYGYFVNGQYQPKFKWEDCLHHKNTVRERTDVTKLRTRAIVQTQEL